MVAPENRRQFAVTPREDGRWAVQEIGAERSEKLFDHKADAEAAAAARAQDEGSDVVVAGDDGTIERWDAEPS